MQHDTAKQSSNLFLVIFSILITLFVINGVYDEILGFGYIFYELKAVLTHAVEDDDSWWPMYEAAISRRQYRDEGIYEIVFFQKGIKFQYPPITLLPYMVLIKLGLGFPAIVKISAAVSLAAMFAIGFFGYKIITTLMLRFGNSVSLTKTTHIGLFLVCLLSVITFHPIIIAQYLGQIQVVIDLLVCIAFFAWLSDRKYISGGMFAVAALIKPQLMLLLIWALIRKEKACLVGMFAVFIPAGIISLALFGFQEHLDYLKVISHIGSRGEIFWPNQSINGILNRLLLDADIGKFNEFSYSAYNPYVHAGTLLSTIALILIGLFFKRPKVSSNVSEKHRTFLSSLDLATMVLLSTIAAPTVWTHHYGTLWPVFVLTIMMIVMLLRDGGIKHLGVSLLMLCISYLMIANYFSFLDREIYYEAPLNLVLSYFFYGGIILLLALLMLRRAIAQKVISDIKTREARIS